MFFHFRLVLPPKRKEYSEQVQEVELPQAETQAISSPK
jgi:hypothetical protein